MIEILITALVFAFLAVGTLTDLKKREVPDWVSYSAIVSGIGVRLLWAFSLSEWGYLIQGLFGLGAFMAVAYAMYYLGQWGGGDSKLFMGIGALIGLEFRPDSIAISFVVNTLFAGAAYGLFWSVLLAFRNRERFLKYATKLHGRCRAIRIAALVFAALFAAAAVIINAGALFAAAVITLGLLPLMIIYTFIMIKSVEFCCMYKRVGPEKLTEGDWIVKEIIIDGKRICGPKDLGIEKAQIRKLVQLKKENKLTTVLIKEGIPFVPGFLIAFIITILWGNLLLLMI